MKKIIILSIFILAFILRFWNLGNNPPSLDWDEASLGYNAYSLLKTGKDEYGKFLPLSIRSFGDYKPPLYTYLDVPAVALFGLNEFAVRAPSAVFGVLEVIVLYFLLKELLKGEEDKKKNIISLFGTFFLAISPWHIQFSRVAFEANIGLFFVTLGVFFFLIGFRKNKYFIISSVSFALSIYSYHSPRLIVPLLLLALFLIYRKKMFGKLKYSVMAAVLLFLLVFPVIKDMTGGSGARLNSVSSLNPNERLGESIKLLSMDKEDGDIFGVITHNRRVVYGLTVLAGYLDHFNFDFLFLDGDGPGRHHAVGMGMLYWWDAVFVILGILALLREKKETKLTVFSWFLLAPVASAFTTGTPHAVRALYFLPVYQIITAYGLYFLYFLTREKRKYFPIVLIFLVLNFFYYLHMYYIHTPPEVSDWWQYGYKQVVEEVKKEEPKVDKILVTYKYDQPYVFFLFYYPVDPTWYQNNWGSGEVLRAERNFGKFEFRNINWSSDQNLKKTLIIGTPDEIPDQTPGLIKNIYFLNGQVAFRIVER